MARQARCLQGQDRSPVTYPNSILARRCLIRLCRDISLSHYTAPVYSPLLIRKISKNQREVCNLTREAALLGLAPEIPTGVSRSIGNIVTFTEKLSLPFLLVPPSPAVQRSGSVNMDAARLDLAPEITKGVSRSIGNIVTFTEKLSLPFLLVPPSPAVQRSGSVNMDAARLDLAPEITKGVSRSIGNIVTFTEKLSLPFLVTRLTCIPLGWRCSELVPPSPAVQRSGSVNMDAARLDLAPEITKGVSRSIGNIVTFTEKLSLPFLVTPRAAQSSCSEIRFGEYGRCTSRPCTGDYYRCEPEYRSYPFPSWLHVLPAFLWGWRCSELVPPSPAVQRSGSVNMDAARLDLAPEITKGVSQSIGNIVTFK
ncbi:hypothetical protein J6590_050781 [Homalodisca vitripennis]|nr:hypothetical protein J6590_050781 [Homalodisca vitripennis]